MGEAGSATAEPAGPSPARPGARNWILVNLLGVVWGTSFLSIGIALETLPPLWVAAARTAIAAALLLLLLPVFGLSPVPLIRPGMPRFWIASGLFGLALPFSLLAWGQQHVPSAVAGVAMGSVPLLLVPLVYVFSPEEGIGPRRVAGLVLGFLGLALLIGPGAVAAGGGPLWTLGAIACICAALGYAVASVITRRSPAIPSLTFAAGTMFAAAATLVPLALIAEGIPDGVSSRSLVSALYLGILPTGVAVALRTMVIRSAGSLFMSMTSYLVPVWAVIFGIAIMDEALPPQLFYALVMILGGIACAQSRQIIAAIRGR